MKVIHYEEIMPVAMAGEQVKKVEGRVMIGQADGAKNFCMRLFEMGKDGQTPKHTHDWEHEIFVHQGKGEVFIEGQWFPLSPGTAVFVPPNVEHQFRNKEEEPLMFVCLVPPTAPEL